MSMSQHPMIHEVIPYMDIINKEFEQTLLADKNTEDDAPRKVPLVICKAVQKGLIILNKYYVKTDESVMWKTAMCIFTSYFFGDILTQS